VGNFKLPVLKKLEPGTKVQQDWFSIRANAVFAPLFQLKMALQAEFS
jgi:hypothetical protein